MAEVKSFINKFLLLAKVAHNIIQLDLSNWSVLKIVFLLVQGFPETKKNIFKSLERSDKSSSTIELQVYFSPDVCC